MISLQEDIGLIEDKLKKLYEKDKDKKEKKALGKIVSDPNFFYNYAKKFSRESKQIGPLMKDDVPVSKDKDMAEILINQYSSVLRNPREEVTKEFVEKLIE